MRIYHQECYQGTRPGRNYFEGYYFRAVSRDGRAISLIPGISMNKENPHSFVQIIDSMGGSNYISYPLSKFEYSKSEILIKVQESAFSNDGINLCINNEISISGKVLFKNSITYPYSLISPNIMGPFSYVPFLECRHGIVSVKSDLEGELILNREKISFDGGVGYIEKDWGRSFPSEYIWAQTNVFPENNASFMMSSARVPIMGKELSGLIAFLYFNGRFYKFTTYNGAKIKQLIKSDGLIECIIKSQRYTLVANIEPDDPIAIIAPDKGVMSREIRESGNGKISLELYDKEKLLFSATGNNAAIEICGDILKKALRE
jgi:tocopherol cyclase